MAGRNTRSTKDPGVTGSTGNARAAKPTTGKPTGGGATEGKPRTAAGASDRIATPSNIVSMFRMLLVLPLVLLFDQPRANQLAIAGVMLLAYASDLLDGWLARKFGGETNFGRIIDPLADKVVVIALMLLLMDARLLPLWYVIVVIARDLIIFAAGMYLRRRSGVLAQSTMLGKVTVVGIGLVMMAALFGSGGTNVLLQMLMFVSLGLIFASLYMYGERFFRLLRKAGARK